MSSLKNLDNEIPYNITFVSVLCFLPKLYRKNYTFEFFLKHQYQMQNINISGGNSYADREVWIPYQIDMETGNIY